MRIGLNWGPRWPRVLGLGFVLGALLLAWAPMAQAGVSKYTEPAFTKGTSNTWWFLWNNPGSTTYKVCYTLYTNGVAGAQDGVGCTGTLSTTASSQNLQVAETGLSSGSQYGMCAREYSYISGLGYQPTGSDSCSNTTMDAGTPSASTGVDGTATYTNNPTATLTINYYEPVAYPWPGGSTFDCWRKGTNTTSTGCQNASGGADQFQFDSGCSSPSYNTTSTSNNSNWQCTYNLSPLLGFSDGTWYYCVREADAAMPDNPSGTNQLAATSDKANLSPDTPANCGYIILDRTPPTVSPTASSTSPTVGQLVTFGVSAHDNLSGTSGTYDWDFGDNSQHGSGSSPTHTYTQAGTYVVKVTTQDGAGNTGSNTLTINVAPASTGGTGGGNTGGTGGSGGNTGGSSGGNAGAGGGGSVVTPAANSQIGQQGGAGGGTQTLSVGGSTGPILKVVVPTHVSLHHLAHHQLLLDLTAPSAGTVQLTLTKGHRQVAHGKLHFRGPGSAGFKLGLPRSLKPGHYRLSIKFSPTSGKGGASRTIGILVVT